MQNLRKPLMLQTAFSEYEATHILGEGGSGVIYLATDPSGTECAIKLLAANRVTREKRRRFKNEIVFCHGNKHKNVLTIADFGVHDSDGVAVPFYVMPRYSSSLRVRMNRGITPDDALEVFGALLDGVEAAHLQGVIHRDLKPENVLLGDNKGEVVIADFGIARFLEDDLFTAVETQDTSRLANFVYAAPEQRARGCEATPATDIYALGLILNEMLTGDVPQGTDYRTIEEAQEDLAFLDQLVAAMIRQSQDARIQSIEVAKQMSLTVQKAFVSRQKLSVLTQAVIPAGEIDDPLILDPIRLVDVDWEPNTLSLQLSQSVSVDWISAFNDMPHRTSVLGHGPETFSFRGNVVTATVSEQNVKSVVDYFKDWLPIATRTYEQLVRQKMRRAEVEERERLQRKIEAERARQRVLDSIEL